MSTVLFRIGVASAGMAVALGAFGAHGLRAIVSPEMLAVFETGVRYQMYHALALMLTAAIMMSGRDVVHGRALAIAGWSFIAGMVLFSGSLYLLAVTGITVLGAITPIGGVAFLLGWACLAIAML
jgi:uncharacterized membrane protein YgdD (TMEM256/DUF423 family)